MSERTVVLLCGPPGAGKTTAARASGLTIYDRDEPQWTSDRHFGAALSALGRDPRARAVVIRSGATSTARATAARQVGATHVYVITGTDHASRITTRGRADRERTIAGVTRWLERTDRADGVPDFPGWGVVLGSAGTSEDW